MHLATEGFVIVPFVHNVYLVIERGLSCKTAPVQYTLLYNIWSQGIGIWDLAVLLFLFDMNVVVGFGLRKLVRILTVYLVLLSEANRNNNQIMRRKDSVTGAFDPLSHVELCQYQLRKA